MDEILMDLQVFAQEFLLREHLTMKFSWNLSNFLLEEKPFWAMKTLYSTIRAQVTYL